jgi:hypothetical protein
MQLLHNFAINVAQTTPGGWNVEVRRIWANEVPSLAFKHNGLLYTLLSLSASHMVATCQSDHLSEERKQLREANQLYFTLALSEHNNALSNLDESTADFVCLTCMLIPMLIFRNLTENIETFEPSSDQAIDYHHSLAQRFAIVAGTGQTFRTAWSWIRAKGSGSLAAAIVRQSPNYAEVQANVIRIDPKDWLVWPIEYAAPFRLLLQNPITSSALGLEAISDEDEEEFWDEAVLRAYTHSLSCVGALYHAVKLSRESDLILCQRLMAFGSTLPSRFLQLLEEGRPRALVIIAISFALLKGVKHVWWIGDNFRTEVDTIRCLLNGKDLWKATMDNLLNLIEREKI